MDDSDILSRIKALVDEEHRLLEAGPDELDEKSRLASVETQLDQCWDLLRQRRGRRHAGADPDDARPRDAATVERYLQ
jgi:hypothetical protein